MFHMGEFSRLTGFIISMVFSAAVIFFCSFGIVGIFQTLSESDLDDLSAMSNSSADEIVASITGISIDEDSIESKLVDDMTGIINGFEDKDDYSFEDATTDAEKVLNNVFSSDSNVIMDAINSVADSVTSIVGDSASEEDVKNYVDDYFSKH